MISRVRGSCNEIYARRSTSPSAESLGFTTWAAEHHFSTSGISPPGPAGTFFAAKTTRIRVARPHRGAAHHPLVVAEEIATLDLVSGGRLDV